MRKSLHVTVSVYRYYLGTYHSYISFNGERYCLGHRRSCFIFCLQETDWIKTLVTTPRNYEMSVGVNITALQEDFDKLADNLNDFFLIVNGLIVFRKYYRRYLFRNKVYISYGRTCTSRKRTHTCALVHLRVAQGFSRQGRGQANRRGQ